MFKQASVFGSLSVFACVGLTSAQLIAAPAAPTLGADYTKVIATLDADYSVEMFGHDAVKLVIKGENLYSVVAGIESSQLAACAISSRVQSGDDLVLTVTFEAELDDGENSCVVALANASFNSSVKLFVNVQD